MRDETTVRDRLHHLTTDVSPTLLVATLALAGAFTFGLLFLQEPMAHEAVHNFRHGAGITCH